MKTALLGTALASGLLLAGPVAAAGTSGYGHAGNSFSTGVDGNTPSVGNNYGSVTNPGSGYHLSGQNRYNLNAAPNSQAPALGSYGYGDLYGSPSSLYRHYLQDSNGGAYRWGYLDSFLDGGKVQNKLGR